MARPRGLLARLDSVARDQATGMASFVTQPGSIGGSQRGDIIPGIANLKVAVLATNGFEQVELIEPMKALSAQVPWRSKGSPRSS